MFLVFGFGFVRVCCCPLGFVFLFGFVLWFGVRKFRLFLCVCGVCFVWFRLLCGFRFVALRRVALGCVAL